MMDEPAPPRPAPADAAGGMVAGRVAAGRIAVGVSGAGSNLRALAAAAGRGELGGSIALVFADRDCPAVAWAAEQGLETAVLPGLGAPDPADRAAADADLAATLAAADVDVVVLAGFMRIVGPAVLGAFAGRILNTHPSLLPAFPGGHAVRDALAHGAKVTGCTVHLVDATLDGGPIVAQEAVPVLPGDDEPTLHDRIRAVEHRLLPRAVANLLAGALRVASDGRTVALDTGLADAAVPVPRRALLSVSDKTGLVDLARGLVARGFELVSTGGTARAVREAGLPVTDVASVTGFPEMLDGRIKTLHPRVHGGILADRRLAAHREAVIAAGIAPFELVVVNLYPFAATVERPGVTLDEVVEEIDIGGPSMVRAAAKNHASVAIVTAPARYGAILAALDEHGAVPLELRSALAIEAFRHTAAYDARIAQELPCCLDRAGVALPPEPGLPRSEDGYPDSLTIALEKVETLRYGENPHQPAARYRRPGSTLADGPFGVERPPLQGRALSYNNVLDAAAADALGRAMHGAACVVVKHTNPCGAAERPTLLEAWSAALEADPVSAFGGVVALTREVDRPMAEALVSIFLEIVVAPGYTPDALAVLATKPNLRVLVDELLADDPPPDDTAPYPSRTGSFRTAGGAVLVTAPDSRPDDPSQWVCVTRRDPDARELADLDLAWRLCRGVTSNAIVLVRDGRQVGLGSGQTSRVDAARQAVEKARSILGEEAVRGAACASDAFFPFPDAVEVCLAAGVTAFVQPGGSINDAKTIAAVDAAGATMLVTGTRHFRH
jgi:phosphoribosylaminoimidazolecarboxamide formyltransferase/IMP cyclohydrolase